jgi:DNA topoisomerase VI B subunit
MLKDYEDSNKGGGTLFNFLQEMFCRISSGKASDFCKAIGVHSRTKVGDLEPHQVEKLFKEFQEARLPAPPTDCLAPIGVRQLLAGMLKGVKAEFYAASSREPEVYRGRPFQIEAAIAFGGELRADDSARVIRFANRVPLLFQQSACSSFKAIAETGWRNYNLSQPRGSVPIGPLVIMIHMASVWVPFTSESKEAIADYDEIHGTDAKKLYEKLLFEARKRTAIADAQLDEEGRIVQKDETEELKDDEGVVMVQSRAAHLAEAAAPAEESAEQGDLVSLSKPKKSRKRPIADEGLF